jgi:hypothetical protein
VLNGSMQVKGRSAGALGGEALMLEASLEEKL